MFQTDPGNVNFLLEVVHGYPGDGSDNYLLRSYNNLPLSNGITVDHIAWQLDDPSATALRSTALPRKAPTLADWTSLFGLTMGGGDPVFPGGDRYFIRAHVTEARLIH